MKMGKKPKTHTHKLNQTQTETQSQIHTRHDSEHIMPSWSTHTLNLFFSTSQVFTLHRDTASYSHVCRSSLTVHVSHIDCKANWRTNAAHHRLHLFVVDADVAQAPLIFICKRSHRICCSKFLKPSTITKFLQGHSNSTTQILEPNNTNCVFWNFNCIH